MNGSFFDKIGVADMEKVHSAVIGWMFSDDCCALNKQQKSELLCSLFHVMPSQTFNSFVVEVEHHDIDVLIITDNNTCWVIENKIKSSQHSNQLDRYYNIIKGEPVKIGRKIQSIQDYMQLKSHYCFLTLVGENPKCTNNVWVNTTYKDFSTALKSVLSNDNRNSDYIILNEYLCCITNLADALDDFINDHLRYKYVFDDGTNKKKRNGNYIADSKSAQFCAMKTMNELKASPMLYLSGGSKELFHSNFLYWLGVNYRDSFQELMTKMCCINAPWPEGWTVKREYRHLDLCVTYEKDTGKMRSGKPVVEECAFIIVENKVKSLPELTQLRRYEQAFINHDSGCTYVVLSLVRDFSGHKYLKENTCWQFHHYDELAQMIRDCCPDSIICQEHRPYIRDYCQYVSNLSMMAEEWRIDEHEPFLSQCDDLRELRLNDIYEKVRYAQVAMMLADKLRTVLVENTEEERVVLGMSNTDVILRRGREDADEILSFYGCPEAKPFGQVFISSGMSHGVGLVEAKVKISEDCCLVIQVQGNHYCHAIERENIFEKTGKLSMLQLMFMNFGFGGLKERLAEADSEICHYKTGFVYRWQKVLPSHTVANIIDAISTDIMEIMYRRGSV